MTDETGTTQPAEEEAAQEGFTQTIPNLPWEVLLRSTGWFFQRTSGGMILKLVPTVDTPQGVQMMPPGIEVHFDMAGWEAFKDDVRRDGVQSPIVKASRMPAPPPQR